jgi:alkanesulfonate monooxygenase SsuD/methylene tetrahydromethanopterin reductase-like flavin-dependent oxidoreductase (luciferase family)
VAADAPTRPATATGPEPRSLGLVLPTFPQASAAPPSSGALTELCAAAEAAGAGGLWACDHLYWHGPVLECLTALGVAAAATSAATIGSCVLQLPLRNAHAVAKQAASLQHLADGRLVLGVGAGSRPGEYRAAGADFATRGRALDAGIDRLRAAWRPSGTEGGGDDRQLPSPHPIPLWIGGSSEAALVRAARSGDGWIPLFLSPAEYEAAQARLVKEAQAAGRAPSTIARAVVVFASVGGEEPAERGLAWMSSLYGIPARAFADHLVSGSARDCSRVLERYVEAGAGHVVVFITADDPLVPFVALATEFAGRNSVRTGGTRAWSDAPASADDQLKARSS